MVGGFLYYFVSMNKKPKEYENVKLPKEVVNKIRKNKKKTGVSIMAFTEQAINEKLLTNPK